MRAGALNRRIWVDEPVVTQSDAGELVTDFVPRGKIWGSIEPLRAKEALVNAVNLAQMDTKIRLRWSPSIDAMTSEWRLRYKSLIYDVVSVAHLATGRRELEVLCKSGTNQG